ncbi:MAG: saccharopine dehydrogenase C-terminal domain-containing protein [candidate division WOR-3 bacterium]|jgi:lysine 6-dehydrogenase
MKKVVVLGLGRMGKAILNQLLQVSKETSKSLEIFIYDIDSQKEKEIIEKNENISSIRKYGDNLIEALNKLKPNLIINATTFTNNLYYTQIALEIGSNYIDLGQNTWTTLKQRTFDKLAKEKKIRIVPETGLAPGTINIIASEFLEKGFESVYLYTGGLPVNKNLGGILKYAATWSIEGLIQEYTDTVVYIENNNINFKQGLSDEIENDIKIKFRNYEIYQRIKNFQEIEEKDGYFYVSDLEAISTSDGISLMPFDYKCSNLEYKTLRYKGHYSVIKTLHNLGLFDEYKYISNKSLKSITIEILENILPRTQEDIVFMKVIAKSGNEIKEFNGIVLYDERYTAMQKMTGFGAVISALGIIELLDILKSDDYGVIMPYEIFEPKKYLSYLSKFVNFSEFNYD